MGQRSLWKGPFVHPSLLRKPPYVLKVAVAADATGKEAVTSAAEALVSVGKASEEIPRTRARGTYIRPGWVGGALRVHNGKRYQRVRFTKDRVGHKLGEFVMTRKRAVHVKKLKVQARKR